MAKDDYGVVMFKVLTYLYRCLKEGVEPSVAAAVELAGINEMYCNAVLHDCIEHGYVRVPFKGFRAQPIKEMAITLEGVEFLENSSMMGKVREFIGKAWEPTLKAAIEVTKAL